MDRPSDVIVLGTGASGLAAADHLIRAGLRVTALEARDRVGGRVHAVPDSLTGTPLELGAEFLHGQPPSLLKLARPFGFFHAPGLAVPTWWTLEPHRTRHLVGWAGGPGALALSRLPEEAVLSKALETLARIFHLRVSLLRAELEDWRVMDWQREPFTRGGYCVIPSGATEALEELAAPVQDTLFFAGEATNTEGEEGTVHGAFQTGLRAAHEVLATVMDLSVS